MPVSVTVAPSPKRHKQLRPGESQYLVALAAEIAQEHPQSTVSARYGEHADDVMVIRQSGETDVELF